MPAAHHVQLVRAYYAAYESDDVSVLEQHLHDDFTFWAPPDAGIDRATYFERCWPNSITTFDLKRLFEHDGHDGLQRDKVILAGTKKKRPANARIRSQRDVFSGGGRCWVRTNVG
jgi:ketosteroid isomerase-like protein